MCIVGTVGGTLTAAISMSLSCSDKVTIGARTRTMRR